MAYSLSPERNSVLVMVISASPPGSRPVRLSMVNDTSARPSWGRSADPAKMTSSIFDERTVRGPWAPSTHATASTTLDLPLPFGPTTTVTPGSKSSVDGSAKDLKPLRVSDFRNTGRHPTRRSQRNGDTRAGSRRSRAGSVRTTRSTGSTSPDRPWRARQIWQCSQRNPDRPLTFTFTTALRHRRHAWPSRS